MHKLFSSVFQWRCAARINTGAILKQNQPQDLTVAFQYLKGAYKEDVDRLLVGLVETGQGVIVLN